MANDIKISRETVLAAQTTLQNKNMPIKNTNNTVEGVAVSTHLSQLVNQMEPDHGMQSAASVEEIKRQIQSGQYSVDHHALADKLLNSGVLGT